MQSAQIIEQFRAVVTSSMRMQQNAIMMYSIVHGLASLYLTVNEGYVPRAINGFKYSQLINYSQPSKLEIPKGRISMFRNSFAFLKASLCNTHSYIHIFITDLNIQWLTTLGSL